ncbi:ytidine and deoxycytidylated deaminase zinc-binding protein [Micromonas commoda]|uniref:dCMP deaminase n=1 Tax=Micromonas commoda (strain RCC299 / NOUM17 / CCMP2709) TaxID=296587 RepID=C1FHP1_MICCC|nr:ytidine and deoxycytidylated deaminase zinc-binding protein [Micromonas commoda]ACO69854.1 ytidine and deoxycytidylated deaminase zinc-binding protein [Micromonas commoda]|eukprot:XP_002508596.1 ytidine and deoxycytidylated deaminase zinc-binding protein [Micromonas commoda]
MASIALLSAAFAGAKIQDIVRGVIHDRRARGRGADGATVAGADFPSGDSAADAAPAAPLSPPRPALTKLTRKSIGSPNAAATKQSVEEEVVVCSVCHQGVGTPSSPVTPLNHHRGPPSTPGSNTTTVNSHSGFRGVPAPKPDPYAPKPRDRYLKWDDYFMSVAFLSAQRSKDPNKQVGAVIVGPDRVIMGVGYNGFPRGCSDSDLPWAKKSTNGNPMETKYAYVCHAEMNAIMNKNSQSLHGATVYVTMYPCNECAKLIIQSGIREVVYFEGKLPMARGGERKVVCGDGARSETVGGDDPKMATSNGGNGPTWKDWVDGDLDDEDPDGNGSSYEPPGEVSADGGVGESPDVSLDASSEDLGSPVGIEGSRVFPLRELRFKHTPEKRTPTVDGKSSARPSSESTPTKGGMQNDPTYAAAEKLFELAGVKIRQHTPNAVVDVTYH